MKPILTRKRLRPRFGQEPRLKLRPAAAAPGAIRREEEIELELLKGRLLQDLLAGLCEPELAVPLRHAGNEAAALAWTTPFPLLLLPELLKEKADVAKRRSRKQTALLKRSNRAGRVGGKAA